MDKTYYVDINNAQGKNDAGFGVRADRDLYTCAVQTSYAAEERDDTYEVRLNNKGRLYNPYDQYNNDLTDRQKREKTGPDFVEVPEEVFNLYLRFLNSYRANHLRTAQAILDQPVERVITQ